MAGRGRGRGGSMSFTMEQLGLMPGEALPGPVLQPPPTYPKMEHPPVPLQMDPELEYLLTLKRDFVDFVRDSPAFVRPNKPKTDIQRYSDRYQVAQPTLTLNWSHFPVELRPQANKRKVKTCSTNGGVPAKVAKTAEALTSRLEELEKGERNSEEEGEAKEDKEEGEEDDEAEGEEVDEEMDDGTDYINNYFDNGDGYLEEDDDMDDGPVY